LKPFQVALEARQSRVETGRKPRTGLKLGVDRVEAVVEVEVEAGRKPRPGLKLRRGDRRRRPDRCAEVGRKPDQEKRRGRFLWSVPSRVEMERKLRRKLKHRVLDGGPDGFDNE